MQRFLLQYPWLLLGPFLTLNAVVGYRRAAPLVAAGRVTEAERRQVAVGLAAAFLIFALLVSGLQYASGYPTITCLVAFPPRTGWQAAAWVVQYGALALPLWWLWRGRGADLLARIGPAFAGSRFSRQPVLEVRYTAHQVRRVLTAVLLAATVLPLVQTALLRAPIDPGISAECGVDARGRTTLAGAEQPGHPRATARAARPVHR